MSQSAARVIYGRQSEDYPQIDLIYECCIISSFEIIQKEKVFVKMSG